LFNRIVGKRIASFTTNWRARAPRQRPSGMGAARVHKSGHRGIRPPAAAEKPPSHMKAASTGAMASRPPASLCSSSMGRTAWCRWIGSRDAAAQLRKTSSSPRTRWILTAPNCRARIVELGFAKFFPSAHPREGIESLMKPRWPCFPGMRTCPRLEPVDLDADGKPLVVEKGFPAPSKIAIVRPA